ncbi:MAG: DUF962 domain-containing protein [Bacteroidia bacterium]
MPVRTIQDWLSAYGESHQNATNKLIHWVCVPAIMFTIFGLLMSIPADFLPFQPYLNFGTIMLIVALLFYLRLSFPMFVGFILIGGLMWWGNFAILQNGGILGLSLFQFSLLMFALAWIGQFIGHKIEGKKPSFFDDVQFLLIGPAWLMSFVYTKMGIKY